MLPIENTKRKEIKSGMDCPKTPEEEKLGPEKNYPWRKQISKIAIEAILESIDNINKNPNYKGNFPTNVNDMSFVRKEKTNFEIVGYSTSDAKPDIYKIDFQPKTEFGPGPRFTVEINIKTEKALKVYMTPDA